MNRLEVTFLKYKLKNPVVAASGTYGYGFEYEDYYDPSLLGGVCSKGITLNSKSGNEGIRIHETSSGVMNSIGLENPGIDEFLSHHFIKMKVIDSLVIVNLGGNTQEEYLEGIKRLNEYDVDLIELNISCPNVKQGGMAFGIDAGNAGRITKAVKKISRHPIMVKLSPNGNNIVEIAKACENNGADAISLINTFQAMAVDINKRKPVFDNTYAGLSGPAIKPVALRMVHQVAKSINIPIMGMGGILTWEDALEFIMAGAACVQVGTGNFVDPRTPINIIEGLDKYCLGNGIDNISQLIGII